MDEAYAWLSRAITARKATTIALRAAVKGRLSNLTRGWHLILYMGGRKGGSGGKGY